MYLFASVTNVSSNFRKISRTPMMQQTKGNIEGKRYGYSPNIPSGLKSSGYLVAGEARRPVRNGKMKNAILTTEKIFILNFNYYIHSLFFLFILMYNCY